MIWTRLKPAALSGASEQTRRILDARLIETERGVFDLDITNTEIRLTLTEQIATKQWPMSKVLAVKDAMSKRVTLDRMAAQYRSRGRGWSRRILADIRAALSEAAKSQKTSKK
jgi:hypothetical protein